MCANNRESNNRLCHGTQGQEGGWDVGEITWNWGFEHLQTTLPGSHLGSALLPPHQPAQWDMTVPTATEHALSQSHFQNPWGQPRVAGWTPIFDTKTDQGERPCGIILATRKPHPLQRKTNRHFLVSTVENHSDRQLLTLVFIPHSASNIAVRSPSPVGHTVSLGDCCDSYVCTSDPCAIVGGTGRK